MKITGSSAISEPKTVVNALMGDRTEEWIKSLCTFRYEWIDYDQGVFPHGHTMKDLREKCGICMGYARKLSHAV